MSIQTDQVRSRLEWLSSLSAGPEPSEDTKFMRKVSIFAVPFQGLGTNTVGCVQTSIIATIGKLCRVGCAFAMLIG